MKKPFEKDSIMRKKGWFEVFGPRRAQRRSNLAVKSSPDAIKVYVTHESLAR